MVKGGVSGLGLNSPPTWRRWTSRPNPSYHLGSVPSGPLSSALPVKARACRGAQVGHGPRSVPCLAALPAPFQDNRQPCLGHLSRAGADSRRTEARIPRSPAACLWASLYSSEAHSGSGWAVLGRGTQPPGYRLVEARASGTYPGVSLPGVSLSCLGAAQRMPRTPSCPSPARVSSAPDAGLLPSQLPTCVDGTEAA